MKVQMSGAKRKQKFCWGLEMWRQHIPYFGKSQQRYQKKEQISQLIKP
jgi:hypothetical protein